MVALVVLCAGLAVSACDVTPPAASANGETISTATLNGQLRTLETTVAGGCLLQLENAALSPTSVQGTGGSGTYTMAFTNSVLDSQVGDLLADQYATSLGVTVSDADLTTARSDFEATLDGEISQQVQSAQSEGIASFCQDASGADITGKALLAGLPAGLADAQVHNQAVDEKLLARGADLSSAAVLRYYAANTAQFTTVCVSIIATDTQAHADQIVAQLDGGASFAAVAKSSSLDSQTAPAGGALGCDYTQAQVEQALQQQTVTPGQPIPPIQNSSTGQWLIYEVTSAQLEPLTAVASVVRRELLQSTANVNRVSKEIVAFARHSDVSVDPEYGTWQGLTIIPPVAPPSQYLLAAVSGTPTAPVTSSLGLGGTSGTGSSGSSSSTSGG